MREMKYRVDEFDIDLLFPKESILTVDALLRGLQFDYSSTGDEENARRVEGYFRIFVNEIQDEKIGRSNDDE